jgi:hypothetical protein
MPHPKGKPLSEATKARLREANLRRLEDPAERERCRAQMLHARSFRRHGTRVRVDPASLAPVMEAVQRVEAQLQRIGDLIAGAAAAAPPAPTTDHVPDAGKMVEPTLIMPAIGGATPLGAVAPVASAIGPAIAEALASNHPGIPDSSPAAVRRVVAYDPSPRIATLGGRPSRPLSTRPIPAGWGLRRHLPGTGGADWWTGGFVETTDERGRPATVPAFGPAQDARPFATEAAARDFQRFERPLRGLSAERIA